MLKGPISQIQSPVGEQFIVHLENVPDKLFRAQMGESNYDVIISTALTAAAIGCKVGVDYGTTPYYDGPPQHHDLKELHLFPTEFPDASIAFNSSGNQEASGTPHLKK